jgi:hypothetical protein
VFQLSSQKQQQDQSDNADNQHALRIVRSASIEFLQWRQNYQESQGAC